MLSEILEDANDRVITETSEIRNSQVILLSDAMILIGAAFEAGLTFNSND